MQRTTAGATTPAIRWRGASITCSPTAFSILKQRCITATTWRRPSIEAALTRLASGDALLLFGEGARSRTGQMQRMLPGVARYLAVPGTRILPVALTGAELLFPRRDRSARRVVERLDGAASRLAADSGPGRR